MSKINEKVKYTDTHEWLRVEDDVATVGITDHAQSELADVVYVDLPEVGSEVKKGEPAAVLESVKAAEEVLSPVSGRIIEVNDSLRDEPEKVNSDPYGEGWLFKIRLSDPSETDDLLTPDQYRELIK